MIIIEKMKSENGYHIMIENDETSTMYILKRYQLIWILAQFNEKTEKYDALLHSDTLGTALELLVKGELS